MKLNYKFIFKSVIVFIFILFPNLGETKISNKIIAYVNEKIITKRFVDEINGNNGRYLNSGIYIGKTSFVKEMFDEAIKYAIPHGVIMGEYMEYLSKNLTNLLIPGTLHDCEEFDY